MNPGTLLYKCRRCGKVTGNTHVPDITLALAIAINDVPVPKGWGFGGISTIDTCNCEDCSVGISDLIGGVPDDSNISQAGGD